jgi:hypothetical protein
VTNEPLSREELIDEIRFLRQLVDKLIMESGVPWKVVHLRVKRYESHLERTSWRLSYLMATEEAAAVPFGRKPAKVLSLLPLGE